MHSKSLHLKCIF